MPEPYVVTLSCPDRVGIVHAVTGLLVDHQANITEAAQFNDASTGLFFMRVRFEASVAAARSGLEQGRTLVEQARATLELARQQLRRYEDLWKDGLTTRENLERVNLLLDEIGPRLQQLERQAGRAAEHEALARRLAVIMHRIWVDGTEFRWTRQQAAAA